MCAEYDQIINDAANRLGDALRRSPAPRSLYVWAVFTTAEADGALLIAEEPPEGARLGDYAIVRPNGYSGWSSVPYSHQRSQLWHACRSVAILPLERAA